MNMYETNKMSIILNENYLFNLDSNWSPSIQNVKKNQNRSPVQFQRETESINYKSRCRLKVKL